MRWMRRRGDPVKITNGKYAGQSGTLESNVYQRTVDYPDKWFNGHHRIALVPNSEIASRQKVMKNGSR